MLTLRRIRAKKVLCDIAAGFSSSQLHCRQTVPQRIWLAPWQGWTSFCPVKPMTYQFWCKGFSLGIGPTCVDRTWDWVHILSGFTMSLRYMYWIEGLMYLWLCTSPISTQASSCSKKAQGEMKNTLAWQKGEERMWNNVSTVVNAFSKRYPSAMGCSVC